MIKVVAVLDTMWDWRGLTTTAGYRQAPRFFQINPNNFTGRRLYQLIGSNSKLLVTDACPELVSSPKEHGTPNTKWLRDNLVQLHSLMHGIDVILVCGRVAQKTFQQIHLEFTRTEVIEIPHPAARTVWTKAYIEQIHNQIRKGREQ